MTTNAASFREGRPTFTLNVRDVSECRSPGAAYAELLGWYLGDGYISKGRRDVYNLHIYNDVAYPKVNAHIQEVMRTVKPNSRPHTRLLPGCLATTVSWKHWSCLFPQHGPGRKHERALTMADWQWEVVTAQGVSGTTPPV